MEYLKSKFTILVLSAIVLACIVAIAPQLTPHAWASGPSLCTPPFFGSVSVNSGRELMLTNEFGSEQTVMCMSNDGLGSDFTITQADFNDTLNVQAYASLIKGCHWGACSSSTYNYFPQMISTISLGDYTYGATNGIIPSSYIGDFAWDIWINQDSTAGQTCNNCGTSDELMVWLKYNATQPLGSKVASSVNIGGTTFDVWHGGTTTSYVANPQIGGGGLNFDPKRFLSDMVNRGYTNSSYYVIDAEYGLEAKTLNIPPSANQAGVVMAVCNNLTSTC